MLEFSLSLIKSTWQQWLLCSTTEQKFCFASRIRVNKTQKSYVEPERRKMEPERKRNSTFPLQIISDFFN